jgi:hypothetical protein
MHNQPPAWTSQFGKFWPTSIPGRRSLRVAAINQHAEKLNSEMSDALSFQARMD